MSRCLVSAGVTIALGAGCGRIGFDISKAAPPLADASSRPAQSCIGLAATCGASGAEDCCDSLLVPGGTFARSYDVASDNNFANASFVATVSDFRLDRYEVTVGRFRAFVATGGGTQANPPVIGAGAHPGIDGTGWQASWNAGLTVDSPTLVAALHCNGATWTDAPGADEDRPITCITFYEAMAFCAWDGGFLPTEAEWNYAAAGGVQQRAYPWSSPPGSLELDCMHANYYNAGFCVGAPTGSPDRVGNTSPTGDGRWGQSDLAGNVWEWTIDWYADPYPQNPCNNCANLVPAMYGSIRGGGFSNPPLSQRTGLRNYSTLTLRIDDVGIRCARAP